MNQTIFVLLDGCQFQAGSTYLGYLEGLIEHKVGAKYQVKGELPSTSRPIYETLLTGLPCYLHGITGNDVTRQSTSEHLFSLCQKQQLATAAAAYHWISELYQQTPFCKVTDRMQLSGSGNIEHGIYYWDDTYPDTHLFSDGEFLRTTYKPNFILIHAMGIDDRGHRYGSDSKEYAWAVIQADCILAQLLPKWLAEGANVVITADHGMNAMGIHGGTDTVQREVPLYIFSEKVEKGSFTDTTISQLNVAPLLCRLLDVPKGDKMVPPIQIRWKEAH